ncbi:MULTISPECIES: hypothetical protein [Citrobacter]|uniref:hypothetical protein n=1 Tax=Citrobacter TaxID=544 RepID=UPI0019041EB7|nr:MULTISPECIES: hypothetical protein [Citrobacter]MBJ9122176.1 hypothetical protein [Citrobacter koseri]MDM3067081.1 hypothetical protein [Citrobacter sp. CK180]
MKKPVHDELAFFCRMAAAPYPAYRTHVVGPVSIAPPGIMPDGGCALSGLQSTHVVGPVSIAPPGITPDGGGALSGLQNTHIVGPVSIVPPGIAFD